MSTESTLCFTINKFLLVVFVRILDIKRRFCVEYLRRQAGGLKLPVTSCETPCKRFTEHRSTYIHDITRKCCTLEHTSSQNVIHNTEVLGAASASQTAVHVTFHSKSLFSAYLPTGLHIVKNSSRIQNTLPTTYNKTNQMHLLT